MRCRTCLVLVATLAVACSKEDKGEETGTPTEETGTDTGDSTDSGETGDTDTSDRFIDADGDGYTPAEGDCDDTDPAVHPGAEEICDGKDNDCNGIYEDQQDADHDKVADCADFCPIQVDIDAAPGGTGSFEKPYQSIQEGIEAAPVYDCWEVEVHPGTYYENIDFLGYPVDVRSVLGTEVTLIDGSSAGSVVTMKTGETAAARLYGFTVIHGAAAKGAGIYVQAASPTIEGNVITTNTATTDNDDADSSTTGLGGGLYLYDSGSAVLDNVIKNNSAGRGGVDDGNDGGGIFIVYGTPTLQNNRILSNTAGDGAGIWIARSDALILQNVIDGNAADDQGHTDDAGVYYEGQGGGIHLAIATDDAWFANNIVTNNKASTHGAGVNVSGFYEDWTNPTVVNNVVAWNTLTSGSYGAGICVGSPYATPTLYNNIVYKNEGAGAYLGSTSIPWTYNLVYGNTTEYAGAWTNPTGTNGNLSVDPAFTATSDNDDWTDDDLTLATGSPAIDAGLPSIKDVDGSVSDMGVYGGVFGDW